MKCSIIFTFYFYIERCNSSSNISTSTKSQIVNITPTLKRNLSVIEVDSDSTFYVEINKNIKKFKSIRNNKRKINIDNASKKIRTNHCTNILHPIKPQATIYITEPIKKAPMNNNNVIIELYLGPQCIKETYNPLKSNVSTFHEHLSSIKDLTAFNMQIIYECKDKNYRDIFCKFNVEYQYHTSRIKINAHLHNLFLRELITINNICITNINWCNTNKKMLRINSNHPPTVFLDHKEDKPKIFTIEELISNYKKSLKKLFYIDNTQRFRENLWTLMIYMPEILFYVEWRLRVIDTFNTENVVLAKLFLHNEIKLIETVLKEYDNMCKCTKVQNIEYNKNCRNLYNTEAKDKTIVQTSLIKKFHTKDTNSDQSDQDQILEKSSPIITLINHNQTNDLSSDHSNQDQNLEKSSQIQSEYYKPKDHEHRNRSINQNTDKPIDFIAIGSEFIGISKTDLEKLNAETQAISRLNISIQNLRLHIQNYLTQYHFDTNQYHIFNLSLTIAYKSFYNPFISQAEVGFILSILTFILDDDIIGNNFLKNEFLLVYNQNQNVKKVFVALFFTNKETAEITVLALQHIIKYIRITRDTMESSSENQIVVQPFIRHYIVYKYDERCDVKLNVQVIDLNQLITLLYNQIMSMLLES